MLQLRNRQKIAKNQCSSNCAVRSGMQLCHRFFYLAQKEILVRYQNATVQGPLKNTGSGK